MERTSIDVKDFTTRIAHLFDNEWLLLTSGDYSAGKFNAMTISWGSMGFIWGRPFTQVVVRPSRHTFGFINQYDTFTLCAFGAEYKKALGLLGSKSGRDGDKIAESGLTPQAAVVAAAPAYAQAKLVIECRKLYWQDMDPSHFLLPEIDENYGGTDYHRIFFGEILHISGTAEYQPR